MTISNINSKSLTVFEYDTLGVVLLNQPFNGVSLLDGTSATGRLNEVLEMLMQIEERYASDLLQAAQDLEFQLMVVKEIKILSQVFGLGTIFSTITATAEEQMHSIFRKDYDDVHVARKEVQKLLKAAMIFDVDQAQMKDINTFLKLTAPGRDSFSFAVKTSQLVPKPPLDLDMVIMVVDSNGVATITDIPEKKCSEMNNFDGLFEEIFGRPKNVTQVPLGNNFEEVMQLLVGKTNKALQQLNS